LQVLIKNIRDKHLIEFDKGLFDNWCVYLTRQGQEKYAPKDAAYFSVLKCLGEKHGRQKIYDDFLLYYNHTTKNISKRVLRIISEIAETYNDDAEEIDIWFSVIYAGMVAEGNKENAILGKRIKRLGMYQILCEDMDAEKAANFSRKPENYEGQWWKYLDGLMKERDF
jgi:uncharacterized protein DUF7004